jgi:hypothetical protein
VTQRRSVTKEIDIENNGNAVELLTMGAPNVTVVIRGDNTADYEWDVADADGNWLQGVGAGYSGSSDYDDVRTTGADSVRVRCSSGTNNANDTATITLHAN